MIKAISATNLSSSSKNLKVWVLAPYLQSNDENIDYYYDFSQSIEEYSKTFKELGIEWIWQPVTLLNYAEIIASIIEEKEAGIFCPIVFNICDGDELNGTPGLSVVKLLRKSGLVFTGADEFFYDITTSKIPMKLAFVKAAVPTAAWEAITTPDQDITGIFDRLGTPIILKPAISGGSMGIGIKNVVDNIEDLRLLMCKMFEGYRGWNLTAGGLLAESFINGDEYTTLIVGSYEKPKSSGIYDPVQRVFHSSLPEKEKILSFDRLWEIYEEESPMPNESNFYDYEVPENMIIDKIKKISWDAFVATQGKGYSRVDLRQNRTTGEIFVLEVNAQCGLSDDENYTSIGAILRLCGKSFTDLVVEIINTAIQDSVKKLLPSKKTKLVKINYQIPLGKIGG